MPDVLNVRRRIEIKETVIAPGAIVRLKPEAATSVKDKMARWRVLDKLEDVVRVADRDDAEDLRTFNLEELERVSGGEMAVTGYVYVNEPDYSQPEEESYEDDPYDDGDVDDVEVPSLFDDPITLQLNEDKDDPDFEDDDEEDEDD